MEKKDRALGSFSLSGQSIPKAAIASFEQDGVVCIRNAVSSYWLSLIEHGIQSAINGASQDFSLVKSEKDKGKFSFSSGAWQQVEEFKSFIFDGPVADLALQILQSKTLRLFYDFLLIKEANSDSAATPWHQDISYYPLNGFKVINCWTALDQVPQETALRFWKSSHKTQPIYQAVNFLEPEKPYEYIKSTGPSIPNVDANPKAQIVSTAMNPGDLLIFNARTVHAAPGNKVNRRRAGFSINWVGDDVTYKNIPCLETYKSPELKDGDYLLSKKFPLIRSVN